MKNKLLIIVILLLLIGCSKEDKFYLDKKYYNNGEFISSSANTITKLNQDKENYIVYIYNYYCTFPTPCEDIFKNVLTKYKIDIYSLSYDEMKKTDFYETIKYSPSVAIIKKGQIVAYLDTEKDEDYNIYQNEKDFDNWLNKYIYLTL